MSIFRHVEPPIDRWINIKLKDGTVLRARYLKGPNSYNGWFVKESQNSPGRVYSQKQLHVEMYTESENDKRRWHPYHSRREVVKIAIEEKKKYAEEMLAKLNQLKGDGLDVE